MFKRFLLLSLMLFGFGLLAIPSVPVNAQPVPLDPLALCDTFTAPDDDNNQPPPIPDVCTDRAAEKASSKIDSASDGIFIKIVNLIIYLTASISILMVIFGAFKYVTSQGEASQTKSAKDTILYALIGLFIAISAFTIVRFVISKI